MHFVMVGFLNDSQLWERENNKRVNDWQKLFQESFLEGRLEKFQNCDITRLI